MNTEIDELEGQDIMEDFQETLAEFQSDKSEEYTRQEEELRFESGDQWDEETEADREANDRPCYVTNFVRPMIDRICNPYILNPAMVKVEDHEETLGDAVFVINKVLKDVMNKGNGAESAQVALRNSTTSGRGFMHVGAEFVNSRSAKQRVVVDSIDQPSTTYLNGTEIDGSDADRGIYLKFISEDIAKRKYGSDITEGCSTIYGDFSIPEGMVASLLYYIKEEVEVERTFDQEVGEGRRPRSITRMINETIVHCHEIIGNKVVDSTELPLSSIPIIPTLGIKDIVEGGKIEYSAVVKQSRDSQTLVNMYTSTESEVISRAPNAPFVASVDQISGHEEYYDTANSKNHSVLPYNATSEDGKPLPPPARVSGDVSTAGLIASKTNAQQDMSRSTSMFDAMFGQQQGQTESGVAMITKIFEGELATAHYIDNLNKSLKQLARISIEYQAYINNGVPATYNKDGEVISIDLGEVYVEDLDFNIDGGNNLERRKQVKAQGLQAVATMNPALAPLLSIELIDALGLKNGDTIKAKAKKALPPEFQDAEDMVDKPDPKAIAALEAANQTIEQYKQQSQMLMNVIGQFQTQQLDDAADREAKMAETAAKIEADLTKTAMNNQNDISVKILDNKGKLTEQEMKQQHDMVMEGMKAIQKRVDESLKRRPKPPQRPLYPNQVNVSPLADGPTYARTFGQPNQILDSE